jgi:hypothetical protein
MNAHAPEHDHRPVQHRDMKPPWCNECGLTSAWQEPMAHKQQLAATRRQASAAPSLWTLRSRADHLNAYRKADALIASSTADMLRATADELVRLRAVIENAPHASGCSWFNTAAGLSCICWKANAL